MAISRQKIAASLTLPADRDILVYIFQRGAADGLNAVVPYGDVFYEAHRPNIYVPAPASGEPDPAIDLNGFYGLHPALAPLKSVYDAGDLALVHATGVPHGSRSHFTAQGLVERGVTDKAGPDTGWLGRHMAYSTPASSSAFRLVAISGNVPVSLTGANDEPLAISNLAEFAFDQDIVDSGYPTVLARLFHSPVPFFGPAQAALSALDERLQPTCLLSPLTMVRYIPIPRWATSSSKSASCSSQHYRSKSFASIPMAGTTTKICRRISISH